MERPFLIAQFPTFESWQTALDVLHKSHYSNEQISTISSQSQLAQLGIESQRDDSSETPPTGKSVATGGAVGGAVGAALGTMTMIGPLFVLGPLGGLLAGVAAGGVIGSIRRWGVDEEAAQNYEQALNDGQYLVVVTGDERELKFAEQYLNTVGPVSLQQYRPNPPVVEKRPEA